MTAALRELLAAHALGALSEDEAGAVDAAVAVDPSLAAELAALDDAAADLAVAAAPPPPAALAAVRARLFTAPAQAPGLFARFGARFAALFDVSLERARELLGLIDDPLAWEPGPDPGSWLIHFRAGPACAGADTGFVKLAPGARFAWHRHDGPEHNLVLAGTAVDALYGPCQPGDEPTADAATAHDFHATGAEPYLFAVKVVGVDFTVARPGGP